MKLTLASQASNCYGQYLYGVDEHCYDDIYVTVEVTITSPIPKDDGE